MEKASSLQQIKYGRHTYIHTYLYTYKNTNVSASHLKAPLTDTDSMEYWNSQSALSGFQG